MVNDFDTDLLHLYSLLVEPNELLIKLMDKYEDADRLYYIYNNLKIVRDGIEQELAGSKNHK